MNNIGNANASISYRGYTDWKQWTIDSFAKFTKEDSLYYRQELRQCGIVSFDGLRCLEIGFGNGNFAAWAVDQKMIYSGLEIIEDLVIRGRGAGFNVGLSPESMNIEGNCLDLVVAFDVFEHFSWEELLNWLKMIHEWLEPGGLLIFRVPSGDSPFARALQHGDMTHKITIGSQLIRFLASKNGYDVVAIRPPFLPVFGFKLTSTARRFVVRFGSQIVSKVVRVLFHHNKPTVISANMLVVLRSQ